MRGYGSQPKYESGDTVKVWTAYGRPTGTVDLILLEESPVMYQVSWFHNGERKVGTYEGGDLTLVEKRFSWYCNCKTASQIHARWCNAAPKPR